MRLFRTTGRGASKAAAKLAELERRSGAALDSVVPGVRKILRDVRREQDKALRRYALQFDRLEPACLNLRVAVEETAMAWQGLDPSLQKALKIASANIRGFARRQMPKSWSFAPAFPRGGGLITSQLIRPLDSVGCYVPGGRHPLPSTMLMTVIPAQVAGVNRIVVASPAPSQETMATAHLLGITEFYRVGGAHAIGALAYGTETISRVAKIVGPGNLYVTAAKREVAHDPKLPCGIDMLAGPTEIVVTSETGDASAIANDLIAQAEHDPESLAIFVTTNETLASEVIAESKRRSRDNTIAKASLNRNGCVFLASSIDESRAITNRLAPEHLTVDSESDLAWVQNAGSVFVGIHSPQPMGDYISGPNHTLPTGGMATLRGGLSVMDFVKLITVQEYTAGGLASLGPDAVRIARVEGLTGHAEAIKHRIEGSARDRQGSPVRGRR